MTLHFVDVLVLQRQAIVAIDLRPRAARRLLE